MICPPASVDGDSAGIGVCELGARRFGIIDADAGAGIRLEFLVSRCESQDKFPMNAPVLIQVVAFLCASTSPNESLKVKLPPPRKPL